MSSTSAAPPSTARIQVLGTVSASVDGQPVVLGGPRARAVLGALALARGRTLSAEVLLRDVWGEATPGVRSALRANVARLRATALRHYLEGGREGYRLVRGPGLSVDLWSAQDGIAAGEGADLDLVAEWIDAEPFDGIGDPPFIANARPAARAAVRRCAIRAIDADPQHALVPTIAQSLLARDPTDAEARAVLLGARSHGGGASRVTPTPSGRSEPATPTRLIGVPAPIAAFLPRPKEEARIVSSLRLSRLVTLVGPAGAGKTRLVVEWAHGSGAAGQEHVWFCRAGGRDQSWWRELSRVVGAGGDDIETVARRMAPLRGTVCLDGLDGAGAAAELSALLERAPGISALVTSHRPVGVPGESVCRIAALSVIEARSLFELRSGSVAPVDEVDAVTAAVGRLPLGIELAAAQAAHVPLPSVIHTLVPAPGGAPHPLEAALDATLAQLGERQRQTLERLCVFRDAFTRNSAVGVGADPLDIDVLLAWSLLTDESRAGLALARVPELVRRRLRAPEPESLRARHAEWFSARTLSAFHELTTDRGVEVLRRIEAERADIDAAFEHALAAGDRSMALSIAAGMSWVGLTSGTQAASLSIARRAAVLPGEADVTIEACARLGRGMLAYQLAFTEEAHAALRESVDLSERAGAPDLVVLSHASLAYWATLSPAGTEAAVRSIARSKERIDDASPSARAMATLISAQVARSCGDLGKAFALTQEAGALAERAGHAWVLLMAGVIGAKILIDGRRPRAAIDLLRTVLLDSRVGAEPIGVLIAVSVAAGAAAGLGADAAGARIVGAVDAIGPRYGFDPGANEPADFERYRRLVRQGLTPGAWTDALARGSTLNLAEVVEETLRL